MIYANLRKLDSRTLTFEISCSCEEFAILYLEFHRHYRKITSPIVKKFLWFDGKPPFNFDKDHLTIGIMINSGIFEWQKEINGEEGAAFFIKHAERFFMTVCKRHKVSYNNFSFGKRWDRNESS